MTGGTAGRAAADFSSPIGYCVPATTCGKDELASVGADSDSDWHSRTGPESAAGGVHSLPWQWLVALPVAALRC